MYADHLQRTNHSSSANLLQRTKLGGTACHVRNEDVERDGLLGVPPPAGLVVVENLPGRVSE